MAIVSPIVQYFHDNHMAQPFADSEGEMTKYVSLPFPVVQNGMPVYFQPDEDLTGNRSIITAVNIIPNFAIDPIPTPYGYKDNLSFALLAQGYFVMSNMQREEIVQIPLTALVRAQQVNLGKSNFFWVDTAVWQNCYVVFQDTTGITSDNAIHFQVSYIPK